MYEVHSLPVTGYNSEHSHEYGLIVMTTLSNGGSTEKILLLVEDSADDAALAQRAFAKTSISTKVVIAADGAEALNYLFGVGDYSNRLLPDLILLDLKMPR